MFALALQAKANGNMNLARMICQQTTAFAPWHVGTRRLMNQIRFDSQWMAFDAAVAKAETLLAAGRIELLLGRLLPELTTQADTTDRRIAVFDLLGRTQIQAGQFALAARTYSDLFTITPAPQGQRFAAISRVLMENPDGMYLLMEPYPAMATILSQSDRCLEPGPVSLKDNLAMAAALHDKAIDAMADAVKSIYMAGKNDGAYESALKAFDTADAICPGISLSYRIELATVRATDLRNQAQTDLKSFNQAVDTLGKSAMNAEAYHGMIVNLLSNLDGIAGKLAQASALIKPYATETGDLAEQITRDSAGLKAMRSTLEAELHD